MTEPTQQEREQWRRHDVELVNRRLGEAGKAARNEPIRNYEGRVIPNPQISEHDLDRLLKYLMCASHVGRCGAV